MSTSFPLEITALTWTSPYGVWTTGPVTLPLNATTVGVGVRRGVGAGVAVAVEGVGVRSPVERFGFFVAVASVGVGVADEPAAAVAVGSEPEIVVAPFAPFAFAPSATGAFEDVGFDP